ncbi:epoxide hydrolase, soluble (sEH) [Terramyces sp. JEL0728]|nr:epoxide hydrolase, soluble (sEH) [Terramyces sp. JEL0728]
MVLEVLSEFEAGHEDLIHDLSYNFYGTRMASCSLIDTWKAHDSVILKLDWAHPEYGQLICSCSFDRTIKIWEELESEQRNSGRRWTDRAKLGHSKGTVQDVQFAPNHLGLKIAASSADAVLRIYEAQDPMNVQNWDDFEITNSSTKEGEEQFCLAWCPSKYLPAMLVIGCGRDNIAKVFRVDANNHWQSYETLPGHGGIIRDVAWAPHMGRSFQLIATACSDGHVRIFQLTPIKRQNQKNMFNVELVGDFNDHQSDVWRVDWNVTGTILSSTGDDGTLRLWKEAKCYSHWVDSDCNKGSEHSTWINSLSAELRDSFMLLADTYHDRAATVENLIHSNTKVQNVVLDYENTFKLLQAAKDQEKYPQYKKNEQELKELSTTLPVRYEIQKNDSVERNSRHLFEKWTELAHRIQGIATAGLRHFNSGRFGVEAVEKPLINRFGVEAVEKPLINRFNSADTEIHEDRPLEDTIQPEYPSLPRHLNDKLASISISAQINSQWTCISCSKEFSSGEELYGHLKSC